MKYSTTKTLSIFLVFIIFGLINYGYGLEGKVRPYIESGTNCADGDSTTHLTCKEVDALFDSPETNDHANGPFRIEKALLLTLSCATICALTSLFFNWYNAYTVLFTVYRRLKILDKKIIACQERMNKRAFSDALIGKLAHAANFDFTACAKEAETILKSMANAPPPADAPV